MAKVISQWLERQYNTKSIVFLSYNLLGSQTFINIFDFLFFLLNKLNIKHVIVDYNKVPETDRQYIPLPALTIDYIRSQESFSVTDIEIVKDLEKLNVKENCFLVIAEKKDKISIEFIDVLYGFFYMWNKEIIFFHLVIISGIATFNQRLSLLELVVIILSMVGMYLLMNFWDSQNGKFNVNSMVRKICTGGIKTTINNCEKLSEISPKPLKYFEWSELGVFHFFGFALSTFLLGITDNNNFSSGLLLAGSFVGVLFSFYSIFQQFKVGSFCRICLLTISVFYLLFGIALYQTFVLDIIFDFSLNHLFATTITICAYLLSFIYILNILKISSIKKDYSFVKKRMVDYASDSFLFDKVNRKTMDQRDIDIIYAHSLLVKKPAKNSRILFLFVCSHCPYCNEAIKKIYKKNIGHNIEIRIVHIPSPIIGLESVSEAIKMTSLMISIFEIYGIDSYLEVFDFYQSVNSKANLIEEYIQKKFPINPKVLNRSKESASIIFRIAKDKYNIQTYPTFMLNDKTIYELYSFDDLSLHF